MAFRAYFRVHLPAGSSAGLHANIDAKLATWANAGRIRDLDDTGAADPNGRQISLRLHLAEGAGDAVRTVLEALVDAAPGVRIEGHKCRHGLEPGPCTLDQLYPPPGGV